MLSSSSLINSLAIPCLCQRICDWRFTKFISMIIMAGKGIDLVHKKYGERDNGDDKLWGFI